jgi:hypothetical protein
MFGRNLTELVARMVVEGELIVDHDDPVVGPAIVAPIAVPPESEATE